MDQQHLAGLGNLLTDEILWRAGLSPVRAAGDLRPEEVARLLEFVVGTVEELGDRGGSHTGDLDRTGPPCARCAAPLRRDRVGGRTTYWCPVHQR
jgi:formamidopyrimidine-DNA glycosylase